MSIDDRLYDLSESPTHRFPVYSSSNSYITPYSSDTHGGELVTEFNQRAALNTLLKREVDLQKYAEMVSSEINNLFGEDVEIDSTTGQTVRVGPGLNSFLNSPLHDKTNWHCVAYATGARDESDFTLAMSGRNLVISSGTALVYGYYIDAMQEVSIDHSDAIAVSEVLPIVDPETGKSYTSCRSKFVKLAVQYTANEHSRHDERLIPPGKDPNPPHGDLPAGNNHIYPSAVIVINDELPYGNELLLGVISCDSVGRYIVINNPYKTRLIPLDGVQGAENYSDLLSALPDNHIYGVQYGSTDGSEDGSVTNLKDIDPWLWLHEDSKLAFLLKSMSTNAETAGNATDEPTRGIIVSDRTVPDSNVIPHSDNFNCLHRLGGTAQGWEPENRFSKIGWHQAQVPNGLGADTIDYRAMYLPYALPEVETTPIPRSGILRDGARPQADDSVVRPVYDRNAYPCLGGLNGNDGLMTYQQAEMLELVFMDYIHRRNDGYARGRMFGPFLTLRDAASWFNLHPQEIQLGDYFWVINDVAEAGGQQESYNPETQSYEYANIVTNYGTVSGTVTGTAKQPDVKVQVTGSVTGEAEGVDLSAAVTGDVEGTVSGHVDPQPNPDPNDPEPEPAEITGTVTGTVTGTATGSVNIPIQGSVAGDGKASINATVTGTVTGTLDSFTQNVSSRYVCIFTEPIESASSGDWYFAHGVENTGNPGVIGDYQILDKPDDYQHISDTRVDAQNVLFAVEAVERGFAVPATSNIYGMVKVGTGSELYDVIVDSLTHRLRITEDLLNYVRRGGFKEYQGENTIIEISPGQELTEYSYMYYLNGITFKMIGSADEWRANADSTGVLSDIRGDIILDFSAVTPSGSRTDGMLLTLKNIDHLTLKGKNPNTVDMLFAVDHCVLNSPFFTNIGRWEYSEFISGGNTLEFNLPWMVVTNVFTDTGIDNSMSCRFASVTMGRDGVSSAMLDIWIKHAGWSDFSGNIDRMWTSLGYLNFPPFYFERRYNSEGEELPDINVETIQHIPDNLNLKISGTSGIHQAWDPNNSEYVPGGNMLVNLNWEYNGNPTSASTKGGKLYLNLYLKNTSKDVVKHNFSNLRFRAPVQVIRLDDNSMSDTVDYEQIYKDITTKL